MGPLAGVRVVDMSQMISGPFAATWLADQGAVVKVEDKTGDPARTSGPRKGGVVEIEAHDIGRVRGPRHAARFSATPVAPRPVRRHGSRLDHSGRPSPNTLLMKRGKYLCIRLAMPGSTRP